MINAYSSALSAMQAYTLRSDTAANNIANAQSTGKVDGSVKPYKVQEVEQVAGVQGGVQARVKEQKEGASQVYAPNDANANQDGLVMAPNVDLTQETVNQMMAVTGYKANAGVVKTLAAMDRSLLDITV